MVDVGDPIDQPHDPALQRRRLGGPARVADDPVADGCRQVQPAPVALERVDHPQRVLVVAKASPEPLSQAAVERRLADVSERRMAEIVAETDRLGQILVERQRPGDRARHLGDLERVGQTCAVVVPGGRHEHLRLVLETAKRLAVHDPVPVTLKRCAQPAVGVRGRPHAPDMSARPAATGCAPRAPGSARRSARQPVRTDARRWPCQIGCSSPTDSDSAHAGDNRAARGNGDGGGNRATRGNDQGRLPGGQRNRLRGRQPGGRGNGHERTHRPSRRAPVKRRAAAAAARARGARRSPRSRARPGAAPARRRRGPAPAGCRAR